MCTNNATTVFTDKYLYILGEIHWLGADSIMNINISLRM